jgi:sugar lactone lactonase YvrE
LGLAADGNQQLYVSEYNSGRILQIDLNDGERRLVIDGLDRPEGLALTRDGQLLVAETGTQRLLRIEPGSGAVDTVADGLAIGLAGGDDLPRPFIPTGVAVDADDNIYVTGDIDNVLYKLTRK